MSRDTTATGQACNNLEKMKGAPPYVFVWPYALAFWAVYLWAFLPEIALTKQAKRASKHEEHPQDRGSMNVINRGGGVGAVIAVWIALIPRFRSSGPQPRPIAFP